MGWGMLWNPPSTPQTVTFDTVVDPAVVTTPRDNANETSDQYQGRLGAADGVELEAEGSITNYNTGGGPATMQRASVTTLVLPRIAPSIAGTPCVEPGSVASYTVGLNNIGSAAATGGTVTFTNPQG